MYSFESRIRYSELAENCCLSLYGLVNYMQDCACFESEELQMGIGALEQMKKTWVLNFWQIVIDRYPKMGEKMTITTRACGYEKLFGYRNFMLTDEKGEYIAKAYSIWTLIDQVKGRPVMVQEEDVAPYGIAEPLPMEPVSRKISIPEGGERQEPYPVQECDLDTNHHVNNGQYIRMASAYIPRDMMVRELRVEYKKQALLGDVIEPVVYQIPEGYLVALNDTRGKAYAVVQFMR